MDPYQPPRQQSYDVPLQGKRDSSSSPVAAGGGRPCPSCGSKNTTKDTLSSVRPNLLFVIFGGWFFLLVRGAFAMRADLCRDCGQVNRYKSPGSKVTAAVLIFLLLLAALGLYDEFH